MRGFRPGDSGVMSGHGHEDESGLVSYRPSDRNWKPKKRVKNIAGACRLKAVGGVEGDAEGLLQDEEEHKCVRSHQDRVLLMFLIPPRAFALAIRRLNRK